MTAQPTRSLTECLDLATMDELSDAIGRRTNGHLIVWAVDPRGDKKKMAEKESIVVAYAGGHAMAMGLAHYGLHQLTSE